jgi:hypothetical protein
MTVTDWIAASRAFAAIALETVLRSLLLAALCWFGAWLLRSRSAGLRFLL